MRIFPWLAREIDGSLRRFDGFYYRATGPWLLIVGPIITAVLAVQFLGFDRQSFKGLVFATAAVVSISMVVWIVWRFFIVHGLTESSETEARQSKLAGNGSNG